MVSGRESGNTIAPPARLSWPPAVPSPLTTACSVSPARPPSDPARRDSFSRSSNTPAASDQLTWSNRMKKSAISAMISGWVTVPHQLTTSLS